MSKLKKLKSEVYKGVKINFYKSLELGIIQVEFILNKKRFATSGYKKTDLLVLAKKKINEVKK